MDQDQDTELGRIRLTKWIWNVFDWLLANRVGEKLYRESGGTSPQNVVSGRISDVAETV